MTLQNKLSFQHFKDEIDGLKQEKDDSQLILVDRKKQRIQIDEEIYVTNMMNNELRKKILKLEKENQEITNKRV